MKKDNAKKLIKLLFRIQLYLKSITWLSIAIVFVFMFHSVVPFFWVISVLMTINSAIFLYAATKLDRLKPTLLKLLIGYIALNLLLNFTDEVGLPDIVNLALDGVLFVTSIAYMKTKYNS